MNSDVTSETRDLLAYVRSPAGSEKDPSADRPRANANR